MESGKDRRRELGMLGEQAVCDFLCSQGHTVLERNWRCGHLEIDIISYDAEGIHFVEVKSRRENIQAPPQDSVDRKKQQKIVLAAQRFLRSGKGMPYGNHECMFDVAAVTFVGETYEIAWFPQAFIPIYI